MAFVVTGFVVGILGGMLGIGGAIVLVPALVLGFGFSQGRAQGTTLGALVPPIGIFAAIQYYRNGLLDIRASALIASGFLFGALAGASVVPYVPQIWLKRLFSSVLIYIAIRMMFDEPGRKAGAVLPGMVAIGVLWLLYGIKRLLGRKPPPPSRPTGTTEELEYFI
jgi:uncharacterized protein